MMVRQDYKVWRAHHNIQLRIFHSPVGEFTTSRDECDNVLRILQRPEIDVTNFRSRDPKVQRSRLQNLDFE